MTVEIPTCETFYEYRGERFRRHSGGDRYQRVWVDGSLTQERFPDALEFSSNPDEPWVMLPLDALDAGFEQVVLGRWHGAPVTVVSEIRRGLSRGLVRIEYAGNRPDEAIAAGLHGGQYNGWSAEVPPGEVQDITVETTRFEIADMRGPQVSR